MAKASKPRMKPLTAHGPSFVFGPVASKPKATKEVISLLSSDEDNVEPVKGKGKARATIQSQSDTLLPSAQGLWIDRFAPQDTAELAVHKKKVQDVKHWLQEALQNQLLARFRRILVLSGPSGTGKTAVLQCLAKDLDFEVVEFKAGEQGGADALPIQFTSFLARASSVPTLQFTSASRSSKPSPSKPEKTRRKVILVEDLPNIFTSEITRAAFRNALTAFVKTSRDAATSIPMVLIISEALSKPGNDSEWAGESYNWNDNVSARSILPPDILKGGKCTEIKFNPVADTILKKGLEATLDKAMSKKTLRPTPQALAAVVRNSNGDIRSAINNLEFLVREGDVAGLKILAQVPKGKKRASSGKFKDDDDANLADLIHGRETSLFVFHALGKVLYSKRWGEKPEEDEKELKKAKREPPPKPNPLPSHLKEFKRKLSKVDPNEIFANAPVDSDLFMAYLHQNYPQFTCSTDECSTIMDYMSMSDALMRMEGESFARHPLTSQYSFQVSVRGMMIGLPAPVPRKGQKMYKAELWERNRKMRDNASTITTLLSDLSRSYHKVSIDGVKTATEPFTCGLTTRRVLVHDLLAFPVLATRADQGATLPPHVLSSVKELSNYKLLRPAAQQILDEDELERSHLDAEQDAARSSGETGQEELLYLAEDDIEDFD